MERPLLNDANIYPTDEVLACVLDKSSEVYQSFVSGLPKHKVDLEWRYYNDSKAWLGKATAKKKTVFWMSVWQGFFRVTFYFTEKTRIGIQNLTVSDEIKTKIENEPVMGKLIPLVFDISEKSQLDDVFALVAYKLSLK